jgi:succinoglycan biosynthesis transport protein ExoP
MSMPDSSARPLRSAIEVPTEPRQSADNLPFVWAFEVLRRRYRTIVFSTLIACAFALAYILLATPYYTASIWLMTDTRRSNSPSVLGDVAVDPAVVESQIETVRSQKIALAVINRLNLQNDPEFVQSNLFARVLESLGLPGKNYESPATMQRRILDFFERKLKVSQISRSYVAEIQFTSIDPEKAASVANAVADSYIDDQLEARTSGATRAAAWVEQRLDELRRQANEAARASDEFKRENNIVDNADAHLDDARRSTLRALNATAVSARQSYDAFQNLNRYSKGAQQQSPPVTEARALSQALPPTRPSWPKTNVLIFLSLMAGCAVGAAIAFAQEHLDRSIRMPHPLEHALGMRCLGSLPILNRRGRFSELRRDVKPSHRFQFRRHHPRAALLNIAQPIARAGEALMSLGFPPDAGQPVACSHAVGIVSAHPGEGKTTIAFSLAHLIANAGKRVLLIDGDLRNPSLTRLLAPECKFGLPDALDGRLAPGDLPPCMQFGFSLLSVPLNALPKCPPQILGSPAMRDVIAVGKKNYDYVIVDLPAALEHLDAQIISNFLDAFVVVVEWGRTTVSDLEEAFNASPILDRLVGALINKAPLRGTAHALSTQGR